MTFEIKSGFVGLQGKVISSRNFAGPGNRCQVCLERSGRSLRQVRALLPAGAQQLQNTACHLWFRL